MFWYIDIWQRRVVVFKLILVIWSTFQIYWLFLIDLWFYSCSVGVSNESTSVDMSIVAKKAAKLQVTVFRRSSFSGKLVQRFRNRCVLSTGEVPFTPSVELNATNGKETSTSHNSTFVELNVEAKGKLCLISRFRLWSLNNTTNFESFGVSLL